METDPERDHDLIRRMYDSYNARDLQRLAAFLCEDVDWPDGELRLHGLAAVKDYWSRQWERIRTYDQVVAVADIGPRRTAVRISQVVRDLGGEIISTGLFEHIYEFRDGLVRWMELRELKPRQRSEVMNDDVATVKRLYAAFNERNIPDAVALMAEDVEWANGMDGGHVRGREAVRDYWTKQWAAIQPQVKPLDITDREDGSTAVEVHQVVRDLEGGLLLDERVRHVFHLRDSLVVRFDIENAGGLSALAHD